MCILCVIQKWSRRAATMLPWLVIPLIGLWALSQLLPPAFRFEITSPRLACVFVLLVTLFWYEILMPRLSVWRVRRNARLREKKRLEAIEMQKLRKTAIRRCRNCFNPYKDQNPSGGRFMCAYCGHNSKRPVLDLLVPHGVSVSSTGIIKDLAAKGEKVWSETSLLCSQDWLENGNWVGGSGAFFGGDDHCMAEQSYFGVFAFACKLMNSFFLSIRWLLKNMIRISLSRGDDSSDADNKGVLARRGENMSELHETKSDKARRKAEEKRQARLEKELLEEEERKQRDEVTRLVEERRRLRDEKMEAERDQGRGSVPVKEKARKKEPEQKQTERKKDKDKGSSKSSSDVDEREKNTGKESDCKQDFDQKMDYSRKEGVNGSKIVTSNNYTKVYAGNRYFDGMKGSFLTSSKAFSGESFFGRASNTPAATSKENRSSGFVENGRFSPNQKELPQQPEFARGKVNVDTEVKHGSHTVPVDPQQLATPKKTWQQLFTGSVALPQSAYSNVISKPNQKPLSEVQSPRLSNQSPSSQTFDNHIDFGLPSPFTQSNFSGGSTSSSLNFPSLNESMLPHPGETPHESPILEEPDFFEDPCYVPDPVYLFGQVSESLDSFQAGLGQNKARPLISEINKPAPIESPLSRLKIADDKFYGTKFSSNPNVVSQDLCSYPLDDSKSSTVSGTWHMWNSSPLVQDCLGLANGMTSWPLPPKQSRSNFNEFVQPPRYKNAGSLFTEEEKQGYTSTDPPQHASLRNCQAGGGIFPPLGNATDQDTWRERPFYPPISGNEHWFPFNLQEEAARKEMMFGNPRKLENNQPLFDPAPANSLPMKENESMHGDEGAKNSTAKPPIIGGVHCNPEVQSLWSFD